MITEFITSKCPEIMIVPEISNASGEFSMITSGGVEVEVGEWIYALVRMVKPKFVLETGTHFGLSSSYIAMALQKNKKGRITTLDPFCHPQAKSIWNALEISDLVTYKQMSSLNYTAEEPIDVLFLDSEPHLRFQEFVRFFDKVSPGGIIMIHDLHPHLSFNPDHEINGMKHWPYGDFRETIGPFIKSHQVQTISFPTPRGFTVFQKEGLRFNATRYLRSEI